MRIGIYARIKLIPLTPKPRFLDLHLSISNDIVYTKIYDKNDNFDFEIVNFPFLDGDVPWRLYFSTHPVC